MLCCLYIPDFIAAAVTRAEPELGARPLAVLEGTPPLVRVCGTNDLARQAGVEIGMGRTQAETLVTLELRTRSPGREQAASAALLDCACSFSPRVEPLAPDSVLLSLAGAERLFGPPEQIAQALAQRAGELGLTVNVAVAQHRETAQLAARGFQGITILPSGHEAERLGTLPIDVLCASDGAESQQLLETLDRWGMHTLRALAALPEVALAERLGQAGLHWQKLARGLGSETLAAAEPLLVFEEAMELEHPLESLDQLAFVLSRLLEQICVRLGSRALATNELRVTMELDSPRSHGDTENNRVIESSGRRANDDRDILQITRSPDRPITRSLRLPQPMLDAKTFLRLLLLELSARPPGAPVMKVALAAEPVKPQVEQHGLFLPQSPEPQKLELTLARLAAVAGEAGSPQLQDTHRPDAFTMNRFSGSSAHESCVGTDVPVRAGRAKLGGESSGVQDAPALALRLFRPPLAASVTLRNGWPTRLRTIDGTLNGEIVWIAGPWRISGDWWRDERWARDEWDVALHSAEQTALYRLVQQHDGRWCVEGEYD